MSVGSLPSSREKGRISIRKIIIPGPGLILSSLNLLMNLLSLKAQFIHNL